MRDRSTVGRGMGEGGSRIVSILFLRGCERCTEPIGSSPILCKMIHALERWVDSCSRTMGRDAHHGCLSMVPN